MFNCVGCAAALLVGSLMAMDTSADYHEFTEKGLPNEKGCSVRMPFGNFPAITVAIPLVFFCATFKES
jgi:hypothetical protein